MHESKSLHELHPDLLILGAGSAGLSLAYAASQMGAKVVLLEGAKMGGDCLNTGCVPSKALLSQAAKALKQKNISYEHAQRHVQDVIEHIAPIDSQERFEGLGVTVIRAFGKFTDPHTVIAGDTLIKARRIVIATGSTPFIPPIPGLENTPYLTNETIWGLKTLPAHLIIIGGGPIGLEMAQAHRRLGAQVSVIEAGRALSHEDPELAEIVVKRLKKEGVRVLERCKAKAVRAEEPGDASDNPAIIVETEDEVLKGTHLLIAAGRKASIDALNLQAAKIRFNARGVDVDQHLRSSNRRVYAIGDVAGGAQFTHLANYHAGVVLRPILLGLPAKTRNDHIPHCTYTDPEIAQIGMTEEQARAAYGAGVQILRFPYAENDRAIATEQSEGLIKLIVRRGRPVGVSICGASAGELINFWSLVMANRMKLSQVAKMVACYPTLSEINKRVAGAYFAPKLFESGTVKKIVSIVQRFLP